MASSENPAHADYDTASEKYDAAHRRELADSGVALPDGSYPVADAEDLHHAIHAVGRAPRQPRRDPPAHHRARACA